jgi:hypothetical protein
MRSRGWLRQRSISLAVCVAGAVFMLSGVQQDGLAAPPPSPGNFSLQAADVPGFTPIDPSIETFGDPSDQGLAQAFVQCASNTPLLHEFDTGPQATVSQVYGQGSNPFGTPALAVGSAVFTDGSAADVRTAYAALNSSSFQHCWAATQDSLNAQQGITTPITPSTISALPTPPFGSASDGFNINVNYSALGTTVKGQMGISIVASGAVLLMLITTAYNTEFPDSVRTSALAKIVGRIPAPTLSCCDDLGRWPLLR